jgi:hypothetical protein
MRPGIDSDQGTTDENNEKHDGEDILANSVARIRIGEHQILTPERLPAPLHIHRAAPCLSCAHDDRDGADEEEERSPVWNSLHDLQIHAQPGHRAGSP